VQSFTRRGLASGPSGPSDGSLTDDRNGNVPVPMPVPVTGGSTRCSDVERATGRQTTALLQTDGVPSTRSRRHREAPGPSAGRIDRGIGHGAGVPGASESPGVATASYGVTLVRGCRPVISRKVLSDRCCPLRSTRATYVLNGGGGRDGRSAACCVLRAAWPRDLHSWEYGTEPG